MSALERALAAHRAGNMGEAERCYRQVLDAEPDNTRALGSYAVLARATKRDALAHTLLRRAIEAAPDHAWLHVNLGSLRLETAPSEAARDFGRACALDPSMVEAHLGQLRALRRAGESTEQAALVAARSDMRSAAAWNEVAAELQRHGALDEAIACFERALAVSPDDVIAHYGLGSCLRQSAALGDAEHHLRRAVELDPDHADAQLNLANTLKAQGRVDVALAHYRALVAKRPEDAALHSNLLLTMHYVSDAGDRLDAHRQWAARHETPRARPARRNVIERLRVAYLSPDFRAHSVSYFVEAIFEAHDRAAFEVVAYADVRRPDDTSARLSGLVEHWRDVSKLDDDALVARIEADGIDVLVELAGHTAGNRLSAVARRPAPVQLTYLGYPDTTGLASIDARISDALADPPGAEAQHSEALIRIEGGAWAYRPDPRVPDVTLPALLARGYATFGSFNAVEKLSAASIALWSRILVALPDARLLLKSPSLGDGATAERFRAAFVAHGVDAERIAMRGFVASEAEHFGCYADVDVALDTIPYNGTTTTCEALWMGVPVVTLVGECHAGRVGHSLLSRVDLPHCAARDEDAYVHTAISLASDAETLRQLRDGLRARMRASALCDGARLARALENEYQRLCRELT